MGRGREFFDNFLGRYERASKGLLPFGRKSVVTEIDGGVEVTFKWGLRKPRLRKRP